MPFHPFTLTSGILSLASPEQFSYDTGNSSEFSASRFLGPELAWRRGTVNTVIRMFSGVDSAHRDEVRWL